MVKKIILLVSFILVYLFGALAWAKLDYHPLQFPRDEAAHFSNVPYETNDLTEWWFYNGKLTAKNGRQFGYYISYFYMHTEENGKRVASPQFVLQIVDLKNQKTYAYGVYYPANKAYFATDKLNITFGPNISLKKLNDAYVLKGKVKSRQGPELAFSLTLTPTRQILLGGNKGLVEMWGDRNSYYYSCTRLLTAGNIQIGKEKFNLNPQQSLSWMDHQWGDFIVWPGITQWMSASVQLENGLELTLNLPVDPDTRQPLNGKMSVMLPNGQSIYPKKFVFVPHQVQQGYPQQYDLFVPELNLKLALNSLAPKQNGNYVWEGVHSAQGTYQGLPVKGQAFAENTIVY